MSCPEACITQAWLPDCLSTLTHFQAPPFCTSLKNFLKTSRLWEAEAEVKVSRQDQEDCTGAEIKQLPHTSFVRDLAEVVCRVKAHKEDLEYFFPTVSIILERFSCST